MRFTPNLVPSSEGVLLVRDLLSIDDLTIDELTAILDRSARVKADQATEGWSLEGVAVAMIFEKPSTRTRASFEVATGQMGGTPVVLTTADLQLGRGESITDTGRVLSRYCQAIVLRTFGHDRLVTLAEAADVPVINALSDLEHPCQAIADLFTIRERHGDLAGVTVTYLGDGNNTVHALMLAGAKTGMHVRVASPAGYAPDATVTARAAELAAASGGSVLITEDPIEAATGADVLYTDVWASMGWEGEAEERASVFPPYSLDAAALARAHEGALVMHCLPAHRGQEITDEVLDGPNSVVWDQAENRLHTQKAILLFALER